MRKLTRKQIGSPGKKSYSGKGKSKIGKILNPWGGPPVPSRRVGKVNGFGQSRSGTGNRASGSTRKMPTPDSSLFSMGYPRNDPLRWPVERDTVGHTVQPSESGLSAQVAAANNAAVNHAFKRGGYPEA